MEIYVISIEFNLGFFAFLVTLIITHHIVNIINKYIFNEIDQNVFPKS